MWSSLTSIYSIGILDTHTALFLGPEEEVPRKLEFMSFIMHAPSDYYKTNSSPYPPTESELNNYTGFIWTTLEAKDRT